MKSVCVRPSQIRPFRYRWYRNFAKCSAETLSCCCNFVFVWRESRTRKAQPLGLFGVLSGTADRVRVPCVARLHESCFDVFDCWCNWRTRFCRALKIVFCAGLASAKRAWVLFTPRVLLMAANPRWEFYSWPACVLSRWIVLIYPDIGCLEIWTLEIEYSLRYARALWVAELLGFSNILWKTEFRERGRIGPV